MHARWRGCTWRNFKMGSSMADPASFAYLSPEAVRHLKRTRAARIPLPLSPWLARFIRKKVAERDAPVIADLLARLGVTVSRQSYGNVTVQKLVPLSSPTDTRGDYVICIHGGAFIVGQAVDLPTVQLAHALGCPVFSIEYSLAPEHPYPRAIEECLAAYEAIVSAQGSRFSLAGLSAGGGLALALMQRVRRSKLSLPRVLCLLAPWAELQRLGDSSFANEGRDSLIRWKGQLDKAAKAYAGKASLSEPEISPLQARDFNGFPPTMIISGTRDPLLSQAVQLYWKLRRDDVPVELRVWEGMWHAFFNEPDLPEASHCREELRGFIGQCARQDRSAA